MVAVSDVLSTLHQAYLIGYVVRTDWLVLMATLRMTLLAAIALSVTHGSAPQVSAQEDDSGEAPFSVESPEDEEDIGAVVVTVNRTEKREFEVTRSVELVTRKEIARQVPKSLADLLEETPGILVQKTNAGAGAPIMRGLVGPDNLILIDGVRFNNSTFRTGPNQYLSLVDPWSLQRVEVVRGPGSVMYGSDAVGGVISAVSLDPRKLGDRLFGLSGRGNVTSAWLGGGGGAQADLRAGSLSGYAGGSYGYFSNLRAGGGEEQPLSDHQRASLRMKSIVDLGSGLALTGAAYATAIRDAGRTDKLWQGRHRSYDNDDILDVRDNCPFVPNTNQLNTDLIQDGGGVLADEPPLVQMRRVIDT